MKGFWSKLPKPFFVLAPMEDVTDTVFRQIVADCAPPDVFFTEFTNVDGLMSAGRDKLIGKLEFTEVERPIVAQIWGLKPQNFYGVAKQIVQMGFDGIDINMGCPERDVLKAGACAALINNRSLAKEIIAATKEGVAGGLTAIYSAMRSSLRSGPNKKRSATPNRSFDLEIPSHSGPRPHQIADRNSKHDTSGRRHVFDWQQSHPRSLPISVKTRLGLRQMQTEDWIGFLLEQGLDALTVHGRTASEMSKVPAHWDEIGKVVRMRDSVGVRTLIVGNGDVVDRAHGLGKAKEYGVDGVMIGRGVFTNLWAFEKKVKKVEMREKVKKAVEHVKLFEKTWGNSKNPQILKKFFKIYINGFEGASELRAELMGTKNYGEMLRILGKI